MTNPRNDEARISRTIPFVFPDSRSSDSLGDDGRARALSCDPHADRDIAVSQFWPTEPQS
jgi:hypothetical protein